MGLLRPRITPAPSARFGLLAAVELVADKASRSPLPEQFAAARRAREHAFANGLVMRAVRDCNLFSPPLVISRQQVDDLVDIVARCYDLVLDELRGQGGSG